METFGVNVQVIENGIDEIFRPMNFKKEKTVLFVGHLIYNKGVTYLAEAIPEVVKKHKDVIFILVGEGDIKITEENTMCTGAMPYKDMPNIYNKAMIFVLPTLVDGRANVIGEAMACGCAVVTTNIPAIAEVVEDRVTGLLVNPKDSKALAEKIIYLLDNPNERETLGNNARGYIVKKKLTWKECAKQYEELYVKCIKK